MYGHYQRISKAMSAQINTICPVVVNHQKYPCNEPVEDFRTECDREPEFINRIS